MIDLFCNQHFNDPKRYTSHNFSHSYRVNDIFISFYKFVPEFFKTVRYKYLKEGFFLYSTEDQIGVDRVVFFVLQMSHVMHDVGYSK